MGENAKPQVRGQSRKATFRDSGSLKAAFTDLREGLRG